MSRGNEIFSAEKKHRKKNVIFRLNKQRIRLVSFVRSLTKECSQQSSNKTFSVFSNLKKKHSKFQRFNQTFIIGFKSIISIKNVDRHKSRNKNKDVFINGRKIERERKKKNRFYGVSFCCS